MGRVGAEVLIRPGSLVLWRAHGAPYLCSSFDDRMVPAFMQPKSSGPWLVVSVSNSAIDDLTALSVITPDRMFGWVYQGHVTSVE